MCRMVEWWIKITRIIFTANNYNLIVNCNVLFTTIIILITDDNYNCIIKDSLGWFEVCLYLRFKEFEEWKLPHEKVKWWW